MPVVQAPIDKTKGHFAIAYAFRPGENIVRYSYEIPYPEQHHRGKNSSFSLCCAPLAGRRASHGANCRRRAAWPAGRSRA